MNDVRVSVMIPAYNGGKYLAHQLDSILPMLGKNDEIVISCDRSTDNTVEIAQHYSQIDSRIFVYINEGERGVWSNSLNALKYVRGEIIFPCDQDDEWIDNKIEKVVAEFNDKKVLAVVHDGYVCDAELNVVMPTISQRVCTNSSLIKNVIHNSITGCCFAFRRCLIDALLSTPITPDAADQWNGICAIILGKVIIMDSILIKHRIHDNNYTPKTKRKLSVKIIARLGLIFNIFWLLFNKNKYLRKMQIIN